MEAINKTYNAQSKPYVEQCRANFWLKFRSCSGENKEERWMYYVDGCCDYQERRYTGEV